MENTTDHEQHTPWNKGVIVGQKSPFKLKEIWAIRVRLQLQHRVRELAMFDLGLDSKLRACDLVKMRVRDICHGEHVSPRATVMQQKTSRPVQFEITQPTRDAVSDWIREAKLGQDDYLFPSRIHESPHIGTRQYARIVDSWVSEIGLNPSEYGTHSMRGTKASLIYRRTKNLRAVQLLLGHTKLDYLPRRTMSRTCSKPLFATGKQHVCWTLPCSLSGNSARKEIILEPSYERADARVRAIGGISAEYLSSFITWLDSQQFSAGYACIVARHALAFGRWCEARGIEVAALTDGEIARYQRSRARRRSRRPETRRQERQALKLLLLFLREQGVCTVAASCVTAVDRVCAEFAQHLRCNHALAVATIDTYTRVARQFLAWRFGQAEVCLPDLRPSDSIAFVRHESKRMAPPAVKGAANALRSFLRFGEFRGEVCAGLCAGVPSVATWTTTPPIPKAIAAAHAQRAIDSCDRSTALGRRDRAVLLLLARLGLRACEIIRLTLDDIDWDQAQLRIRGKGGRQSLLPLPTDVGVAIAAYLQHGRPACGDRHIFLRSMAPIRALLDGSDGVGSIVRYALARANVDAPHRGSHQFRHALAAHMLRQGASLPEIGQVLRHRSPQTTSIYAKVDLEALRTLVVAWPGSAR